MVQRPADIGRLEFAVLSSLRAAQLVRGCIPLIDSGIHKKTVTAQMEVAQLKVQRATAVAPEEFVEPEIVELVPATSAE
jgi:DNA-directed RNA polymerase subunit K/omega